MEDETAGAEQAAGFGPDEVQRVTHSAVNPFCAIDPTGSVLWAGDSLQELLGWSPDEMVGRSMVDYVAPSSLGTALEALAAADDYVRSRTDAPTMWEGVGPVVELLCKDGSSVHCAVAVATPLRTGLPGFVLQFRRAEGATALEEALVAMGRGEPIASVLRQMAVMLEGEMPDVDVAIAHRCTPNDEIQVVGSPAGLADVFVPGTLEGTPWMACVAELGRIVDHTVEDLPEPLCGRALEQGYRWLSAVGVRTPGPAQQRGYLGVWSRHPYENHVFSHQRIQRCADLVGLVLQWEEGRRALEWAVLHDGLTGLANRSAFIGRIDDQPRDQPTAVLYLDLDDFKPVNDVHGHLLGDRVLAEVATRLRHAVRPTDLVARLGGDEFAVLSPAIGDLEAAGLLADRLVAAVSQPMQVDGIPVQVGLSVGIAALVEADDADQVLARADDALRQAKAAGKRRWAVR